MDINKYGELPQMDLTLLWPTHELEVPLTTPPRGRPTQIQQKRQHSSPENTSFTTVKSKKHKKTKKKLNAESSISDNHNSSDDDNTQETNEVAYMHKIITGKKTYTKKDFKKN